jgi:hypothetical protein
MAAILQPLEISQKKFPLQISLDAFVIVATQKRKLPGAIG